MLKCVEGINKTIKKGETKYFLFLKWNDMWSMVIKFITEINQKFKTEIENGIRIKKYIKCVQRNISEGMFGVYLFL